VEQTTQGNRVGESLGQQGKGQFFNHVIVNRKEVLRKKEKKHGSLHKQKKQLNDSPVKSRGKSPTMSSWGGGRATISSIRLLFWGYPARKKVHQGKRKTSSMRGPGGWTDSAVRVTINILKQIKEKYLTGSKKRK